MVDNIDSGAAVMLKVPGASSESLRQRAVTQKNTGEKSGHPACATPRKHSHSKWQATVLQKRPCVSCRVGRAKDIISVRGL